MLHIGPGMPAYGSPLMGLSGGDASVMELQRSLKALAAAAGVPAIDPGKVDGYVGTQTVSAIIVAMNILVRELPSDVATGVKILLIVGGGTSEAQELVKKFASKLTIAAKAATLKYSLPGAAAAAAATASLPEVRSASSALTVSGFLQTPTGIAVVGAGVLSVAALVFVLFSK